MRTLRCVAFVACPLVLAGVFVGCKGEAPTSTETASAPPAPPAPETTEEPAETEAEYTYVCPMHPDETSDKPAKCSVCGMYLEADTDEEVEYYCPHHTDVVQDAPGECAPCGGMILFARRKA